MKVIIYNGLSIFKVVENVTNVRSLLDGRHFVNYTAICNLCKQEEKLQIQVPANYTIRVEN